MEYGKRGMSYGQQQSSDNRPVEPQREEVEEQENKLKGLEDLLDRASNVDNNICKFVYEIYVLGKCVYNTQQNRTQCSPQGL